MKNILLIASKYSNDNNSPYLTNDLVAGLVEAGFHIDVLGFSDSNSIRRDKQKSEVTIKISSSIKYLKYLFIWPILFFYTLKLLFSCKKYHRLIMFGPLIVMFPSVCISRFINADKKIVFIFDIFPAHQVQIKSIPIYLEKILLYIEKHFIGFFDLIIAMGGSNIKKINEYYLNSNNSKVQTKVVNLWRSNVNCSVADGYRTGPVKIIFGGQLIKGRRPDFLIELLNQLYLSGVEIQFDIYSTGPLFEDLKQKYSNYKWVNFFFPVSRIEYKRLLKNYNIGALVTDPNSTLPTFPSKIIDYIDAELYVLGIVEKESDLHSIFDGNKRVHLNNFDCSSTALFSLSNFIRDVKENKYPNQAILAKKVFNTSNVIDAII